MKIQRLYLHDDNAETVITDTMISTRKDEAVNVVRGHTIGEITNVAKGWLDEELQIALVAATATVCSAIKSEILKLPSMSSWIGAEHLVKVAMASKVLYVYLDRPCEGKVSLMPVDLQYWASAINSAQDWFEIGEPWFTSGGYEGCTLQMTYKLIKNEAEI